MLLGVGIERLDAELELDVGRADVAVDLLQLLLLQAKDRMRCPLGLRVWWKKGRGSTPPEILTLQIRER